MQAIEFKTQLKEGTIQRLSSFTAISGNISVLTCLKTYRRMLWH